MPDAKALAIIGELSREARQAAEILYRASNLSAADIIAASEKGGVEAVVRLILERFKEKEAGRIARERERSIRGGFR